MALAAAHIQKASWAGTTGCAATAQSQIRRSPRSHWHDNFISFRDDRATPCNKPNRFEIIMQVRPRAPAELALRNGNTTRRPCQWRLLDVRSSQGQSAPHNHDLRAYNGIACWAGELIRKGTGNLVVAEGVRRESLPPGHANVRERCPTRGCQPAGECSGYSRGLCRWAGCRKPHRACCS